MQHRTPSKDLSMKKHLLLSLACTLLIPTCLPAMEKVPFLDLADKAPVIAGYVGFLAGAATYGVEKRKPHAQQHMPRTVGSSIGAGVGIAISTYIILKMHYGTVALYNEALSCSTLLPIAALGALAASRLSIMNALNNHYNLCLKVQHNKDICYTCADQAPHSLATAAMNHHAECEEALFTRDLKDHTLLSQALFDAAANRLNDTTEQLLALGAYTTSPDGTHALDVAQNNNHATIADLLKTYEQAVLRKVEDSFTDEIDACLQHDLQTSDNTRLHKNTTTIELSRLISSYNIHADGYAALVAPDANALHDQDKIQQRATAAAWINAYQTKVHQHKVATHATPDQPAASEQQPWYKRIADPVALAAIVPAAVTACGLAKSLHAYFKK
jgi:hypothetical protein